VCNQTRSLKFYRSKFRKKSPNTGTVFKMDPRIQVDGGAGGRYAKACAFLAANSTTTF